MHLRLPRLSSGLGLVALAVVLLPSLQSCTAVSRGLGRMTANKYADPRSGTVWVVPPPQLDPPGNDEKTVYISYQNLSDADINLTQLLRDTAQQQGWTLVNDAQEANFRLRARTRFFGEVEPESAGRGVGERMGWIAGAAVGAGTGVLVGNATDDWRIGVGAGVVAGGLAGQGISNASTPREWAMITDFVLEERTESPIEVEFLKNDSASANSTAGTGNARMNDGGGTNNANSSNTSMTKVQNYYPHGVRLSAWANQMNMKEDEAMPEIIARVEKVVQQMLPQ